MPNDAGAKGYYAPIEIYRHGAFLSGKINDNPLKFESFENSMKEKDKAIWRHIAIAFNERSLKLFIAI